MFDINTILTGESLPVEYRKAAEGAKPVLGQLLITEGGYLTPASGADKPELYCIGEMRADGCYPTIRIRRDFEFYADTPLTAASLSKNVMLNEDGTGLTATEGGAFHVVAVTERSTYGYFE